MFDPRRWSLTARLAILFAAALMNILFVVTGLQFRELKHQIREADEAELIRSLEFQEDMVKGLAKKKLPEHFEKEWFEFVGRDVRLLLRVLRPDGSVFAVSPGMVAHESFPKPLAMPSIISVTSGTPAKEHLLTAITLKISEDEFWVIEAALDVSNSAKIILEYWTRLCLSLIAAVGIASLIGWLLARQGLAPLRRIGHSMSRIRAEQLNERIGEQPWPKELQSLAQNFDAMLARLEASFDQLSQFSADVAHEFRTPVNNLVAAASVTLARARSENEYQDTLAVIVEEGERLTRMISSMLFLARADNATQALNKELLSTESEFVKIREFFEALAEQSGIHIRQSGNFNLRADPLLFRRAISNLIANAIQHTPAGGEVRLDAEETVDGVSISVSDTGEGIEPQHLPHLFKRFYRADPSRASSERSGLGLAVVKSIAELHGGNVKIDSVSAKGTRATVVFPR